MDVRPRARDIALAVKAAQAQLEAALGVRDMPTRIDRLKRARASWAVVFSKFVQLPAAVAYAMREPMRNVEAVVVDLDGQIADLEKQLDERIALHLGYEGRTKAQA